MASQQPWHHANAQSAQSVAVGSCRSRLAKEATGLVASFGHRPLDGRMPVSHPRMTSGCYFAQARCRRSARLLVLLTRQLPAIWTDSRTRLLQPDQQARHRRPHLERKPPVQRHRKHTSPCPPVLVCTPENMRLLNAATDAGTTPRYRMAIVFATPDWSLRLAPRPPRGPRSRTDRRPGSVGHRALRPRAPKPAWHPG